MTFHFEPLTEDDVPLLFDWLNRPHVAEWWDGPVSFSQVREKYLPRLGGGTVSPYLACLNVVPIGFIQSYVTAAPGDGWWPDECDPRVMGIDQFLADPDNLGKGLGSEMVAQFVQLLFENPAVTKVQTDPAPNNLRAIRCYEKAGFRRVGVIDTPDGPVLLMIIHRDAV